MAKDYIGYKQLTDAALRGVVREALRRAEKQGLIGSHHFRITFKTHFPGVEIPDFLLEQYPDEMMIILQHQFWGLKVKEDQFEVTLSFRKVPATLTIPFSALTAFVDPGVQFGLQFRGEPDEAGEGEHKPAMLPHPQAPEQQPTAEAAKSAEAAEKQPAPPGEVVSLDSFRKK
ncbi:MAG TPA: ClpXP protease specificity-enhancing factor SspB [Rhizomicrobium sp.]|nr:ClpXP protease specificity-enhancing factor SspB [Rhizomicrobium sp.]